MVNSWKFQKPFAGNLSSIDKGARYLGRGNTIWFLAESKQQIEHGHSQISSTIQYLGTENWGHVEVWRSLSLGGQSQMSVPYCVISVGFIWFLLGYLREAQEVVHCQ